MGTCETRFGVGSLTVYHIHKRFSLTMSKYANSIFADDTSIIISDTNPEDFKNNINQTTEIKNWFQSNLLTLNCDKTHFLQFLTKKHIEITLKYLLLIQ